MNTIKSYCEIKHNDKNIIITSSPNETNIYDYIENLKKNNIKLVIKLNEQNLYDIDIYKENNIHYEYMYIQDGMLPNENQIKCLIELFNKYNSICIHCMSGLGRAPIVGAILAIMCFNYDSLYTVHYIRKYILYAFNRTQLNYLFDLKKKNKKNCIIQ